MNISNQSSPLRTMAIFQWNILVRKTLLNSAYERPTISPLSTRLPSLVKPLNNISQRNLNRSILYLYRTTPEERESITNNMP